MTVFTPYFDSFFFDTYLKCAILALPRAWKKNMNKDCIYNHRTTKTNQKYPSVNL